MPTALIVMWSRHCLEVTPGSSAGGVWGVLNVYLCVSEWVEGSQANSAHI